MKINKSIALDIVAQVLENAQNQNLNPSYEWYFSEALDELKTRPASFFKTEEISERFEALLDTLKEKEELV